MSSFPKPFRDQELLDAIQLGLARDRARRGSEAGLIALRERFASLSPRDREIMIQVARVALANRSLATWASPKLR